jgi:hypothetical protein
VASVQTEWFNQGEPKCRETEFAVACLRFWE